jgi:hypothetical protein
LRAGETTLWPAVWSTVYIKKGIFLLNTKPRYGLFGELHDLICMVAVVCLVGGTITIKTFGEDKDVVATTERVSKDSARTEVYVRVVTGSLIGGGAIEIPRAKLGDIGHLLIDGLKTEWSSVIDVKKMCQPTVVFERTPPSPSIHTSRVQVSVEAKIREKWHTFSLDLCTLV